MKVWFLSIVMVFGVFAGCLEESDDVAAPEAGEDPGFTYQDDRINITGIARTEWTPTLQEPPQWQLGQWWKVRVTEEFTGTSTEAYRVVAGQEEDFWLVGMPTHDFDNELMVLHIPGFGQVKKDTLGFEAHDHWLDPIQFPIEEDAVWQTQFMKGGVTATVMEVEGLKATIEMTGAFHITAVYDAAVGAMTSFHVDGYGGYEIIDHGMAFHDDRPEWEGQVTVPHMSDLIMFHGRAVGVAAIEWGSVAPPGGLSDTLTVDRTYDRVSFSLILGDVLLGSGVPGYYQSTARAPDGTEYTAQIMPTDPQVSIQSHKHDAPGGEWEFTNIAAGPGAAFAEGIGYHVYDIELPSGRILPSIGEHRHGDGEGHH